VSTPHYFSEGPAGEAQVRERTVRLRDRQYGVVTSSGVFSADRLDRGTAVLLSRVPAPAVGEGDLAVDVGCGWGPITLALAPGAQAADPSARRPPHPEAVPVHPLIRLSQESHTFRNTITEYKPSESAVISFKLTELKEAIIISFDSD